MNPNPITIQEAIDRGEKLIVRPSAAMMIGGMILGIVLPIVFVSGWPVLLIPAGFVLSFLYTGWVTAGWRIWAYDRVSDIHQLQRSAELAGLLPRQSHDKVGGFMGIRQTERLRLQQLRFKEEPGFVDDPSIPNATAVLQRAAFPGFRDPVFTLNDFGLQLASGEFFAWDEIENERIIQTSSRRMTGGTLSAGTRDFFRFESPRGRFEVALASVAISGWKLDLLFYIYRGRSVSRSGEILPMNLLN
jgi:hypothetical protein